MYTYDCCVVGSGMAGLTAAALLAKDGLKVGVLEQNWIPGGCTTSYWRKGFVFESGATTLVGLDAHMPLRFLVEQTGIHIPAKELALPMQIRLADGTLINKYKDLEQWIGEAERVFGSYQQRPFWEFCYRISQFVWETSMKQTAFPPSRLSDLLFAAKNVTAKQLRYAGYSLVSMRQLLKRFGLLENKVFVDYVNEQLLITAQNHIEEVNVLFGATALCYTNYSNYYVDGGLINLVQPIAQYIESKGGEVRLRTEVSGITDEGGHYRIQTAKQGDLTAKYVISSIPVNNTLQIFSGKARPVFAQKQMTSQQLNSAFQMGIGFRKTRDYDTIHHQLHLSEPLTGVGSASIFVSLSHPEDATRADSPGHMVASVSTHVHDPAHRMIEDKEVVEAAILDKLEEAGILEKNAVVYRHSSTPKAWYKWTRREWGFVGGYPQYMAIKPWQMLDARLDGKRAYICGDTTYPGQGIPGAALSGVIAWQKLKMDHF